METNGIITLKTLEKLAYSVDDAKIYKKIIEDDIFTKIASKKQSEAFFKAILFGMNSIPIMNQMKNILSP